MYELSTKKLTKLNEGLYRADMKLNNFGGSTVDVAVDFRIVSGRLEGTVSGMDTSNLDPYMETYALDLKRNQTFLSEALSNIAAYIQHH